MERNPYEILGVPRTASQAELKKAFRKLARAYHPDFNPGDVVSERRFKEVQEAYDMLSDVTKRRQYDRFGASHFRRGEPTVPPKSARQFVNEFMEAFLRQELPRQRRGEDLKYYLSVSLEEAALGANKRITINRGVECEGCRGTGADHRDGKIPCPTCDGLGEIRPKRGLFTFRRPCHSCHGSGYKIVTPCAQCGGSGRRRFADSIRVRIPPGVETGQRLKVRGRGNGGYREGDTGDLFVIVHVRDHELFRRQGCDLITEMPVSFYDAVMGGDIDIPTLEGKARIKLPPGTQSGKLYRLKGQGLPKVGGSGGRGDLHARIVVETPVNLTDEQKEILEEFKRASGTAEQAPSEMPGERA